MKENKNEVPWSISSIKLIGKLCNCIENKIDDKGNDFSLRYLIISEIASSIKVINNLAETYCAGGKTLHRYITIEELRCIYNDVFSTHLNDCLSYNEDQSEGFILETVRYYEYGDFDIETTEYDFSNYTLFDFCTDRMSLLKEQIMKMYRELIKYVPEKNEVKIPQIYDHKYSDIEEFLEFGEYNLVTALLYNLSIHAFCCVILPLGQQLLQNEMKEFFGKCYDEYRPYSYTFNQFKEDYNKADIYGEPRDIVIEDMDASKWKILFASGVLQAGIGRLKERNPELTEEELCKKLLDNFCKPSKLLDKEKIGRYFKNMGENLTQAQRFALLNFYNFRYLAYHKKAEEKENKKTAIDNLKSVLKEIVSEHLKDKNIQFDNSSLSPSEFFSLCYVIAVYNSAYDSITESKNKWAEFVGGLEVDGAGKSMVNKKLVEMIDKSVSPETAKSFKESGNYKEEIETITKWLKEKQEKD